jgi:hypothetical protein
VCKVAGAIDFNRAPQTLTEAFDLVLDLGATPLVALHAPPQGYFALNASAGLAHHRPAGHGGQAARHGG